MTVGLYITESTLELQGLSGGELPQLAGGQGELVTLELQGDGGLWLGDAAGCVGQLGDLHHVSAFDREEGRKAGREGWRVSPLTHPPSRFVVVVASLLKQQKGTTSFHCNRPHHSGALQLVKVQGVGGRRHAAPGVWGGG